VNQTNLDWYAARLAVAIFDTNAEYRMGIHNLREEAALESKKKVFLNTPSAPLKRSQA